MGSHQALKLRMLVIKKVSLAPAYIKKLALCQQNNASGLQLDKKICFT